MRRSFCIFFVFEDHMLEPMKLSGIFFPKQIVEQKCFPVHGLKLFGRT
jgi:hypothetical protein